MRFNPYLWPEGEKMTNEVCLCVCAYGLTPLIDRAMPSVPRRLSIYLALDLPFLLSSVPFVVCRTPPLSATSQILSAPSHTLTHVCVCSSDCCATTLLLTADSLTVSVCAPVDCCNTNCAATLLLTACTTQTPWWVQVGRAMYATAGQLGLPVGHMPFKGFLRLADEIEQLLVDYPGTKAVIDHFGFCKCSNLQSPEWQRLLGLAKYPQVGGFCHDRRFRVQGLGSRV